MSGQNKFQIFVLFFALRVFPMLFVCCTMVNGQFRFGLGTVYSVHCTLLVVTITISMVSLDLVSVQCTVYNEYYQLYGVQYIAWIWVQCILYSLGMGTVYIV